MKWKNTVLYGVFQFTIYLFIYSFLRQGPHEAGLELKTNQAGLYLTYVNLLLCTCFYLPCEVEGVQHQLAFMRFQGNHVRLRELTNLIDSFTAH